MSTIHSGSSIPELIKFIRFAFRQSEFDQVQNILMEKEKIMLIEMEKVVKDRDSLKNEFYLLENIRRVAVSEKCSLEGKLGGIKKRCEVLEKEISQLKEKIRILRNEKLVVEKKLEKSLRKCEGREEQYAKMEKEIEDLRGDKLDANLAVEGLKRKEIETNGIVQELKLKNAEANRTIDELRGKMMELEISLSNLKQKGIETAEIVQELKQKNVKANQTIDELRAKMMESESSLGNLRRKEIETDGIVQELKLKNVEANLAIHQLRVKNMEFESSVSDVDPRILMLETKLAKICSVSVEDLRHLVSRAEDSAAADNVGEEENVNLPNVVEGLENGPVNVDAGDRVVVLPEVRPTCGSSSGSGGIGFAKKGSKGGTVQLGGEVSSSAAVDVVVIESDDETEGVDATVTNKRSRTERAEDDWIIKKREKTYLNDFEDVESTDSDDESCSDSDIDNLLQTIQSKRQRGK